jgi:hypothetical protein
MKIFLIAFFIFTANLSYSQSIASHIINNNPKKNKGNIRQITELITFGNSSGEEKTKRIYQYDRNGNLISSLKFNDEGKLVGASTSQFDSLNRLKRTDSRYWINLLGFQEEYYTFEYDKNSNLVLQKKFRKNGNILLNYAEFKYDTAKNLVLLKSYNGNGDLQGYETADYDFTNNLATVKVFNTSNELMSKSNQPIFFGPKHKQDSTIQYNEQGDIVYSERHWKENDNVCYKSDYEYDKFGNMIKYVDTEYEKKKNGKLKKLRVRQLTTRQIEYY